MKKFLAIAALLVSVPVFATGISGLRTHNHSSTGQGGATLTSPTISAPTVSGTVTMSGTPTLSGAFAVSGTVSSTKACAGGYTRATPNLCLRNVGATALTRDACAAVSAPSADAKAIIVDVLLYVRSANGVAARSTEVGAWSDSGCATTAIDGDWRAHAYEHVAVAGQIIASNRSRQILNRSTDFYLKMSDDTGNAGEAYYWVVGYFD